MVSSTKQTETMRKRRHKNMGKARKRIGRAHGTPAFPIQPEGYDPNAADAPSKAKAPAATKD
jgi:hypothetical protein